MSATIREVTGGLVLPAHSAALGVDKLETGHPDTAVTAIATAFMPTQHVIEQAVKLGVNLLIVHEGIYYSHKGEEHLSKDDPVYRTKRLLIEDSGIAIYRYHDHCHKHEPDIIIMGLLESLGWVRHVEELLPAAAVLRIPGMTLPDLGAYIKDKLGLAYLRVSGQLSGTYSRIGVLVGYRGGGATAIPLLRDKQLDLILAGEGPEWETPEYIRDAAHQGWNKALVTLGHAESEEPGMRYLAMLIQEKHRGIPVHYIPSGPVYYLV
ncbi:Nif3-like dinuclear metal center hexameric protein [Paenibacillus tarimensis]|uniref:Nif3-like dinuclear metal center hexameric protein n=1 Tax=Paenibacillus tarimensis TaxID=416012 RepID=UPI001F33D05A|nr:Nif3-like dinuclear metal center hexameric protein [Paenibacillus tarimensis]MCF2945531.1 Nif3-like dinuclear metal center hexameric protein [Paenibacillus tarimensis]